MKLLQFLRFALIGWLSGTLCILAAGLLWPAIFPGIIRPEHYNLGPGLSLPATIVITMFITSLPALIGGLVGGNLPREGGSTEQLFAAALGGIIFAIPFGCFNFWLMSGA